MADERDKLIDGYLQTLSDAVVQMASDVRAIKNSLEGQIRDRDEAFRNLDKTLGKDGPPFRR